jgi:hypothetical protein
MNPLREMIINEIVKPEIRASMKTFLGTIESFNASSNTANVRLGISANESYNNVPFSTGTNYVYGSEPSMGTPVIVSFFKGDMNYPYIVSILSTDAISTNTGKSIMAPSCTQTATSYDLSAQIYGPVK